MAAKHDIQNENGGSAGSGGALNPSLVGTLLMVFIFLLLFGLPAVFSQGEGSEGWGKVAKIWKDRSLLIPLFLLNHFLLLPRLILRKRYLAYTIAVLISIALITTVYYVIDNPGKVEGGHPGPVPPYAELLLFSLLIVSVDTGLSLSAIGLREEEKRARLEKENVEARLALLQHQISPHFFMNTLNNIYALIEQDKDRSREAVMRFSRIMRYLLYREGEGYVPIAKEFEFVRSYVELMKLRFTESVTVNLTIPEDRDDVTVPVLLFVTYLENAFKFGVSGSRSATIGIAFRYDGDHLIFHCSNPIHPDRKPPVGTGIGLSNNRRRLDLIYGARYILNQIETPDRYEVELRLPLEHDDLRDHR